MRSVGAVLAALGTVAVLVTVGGCTTSSGGNGPATVAASGMTGSPGSSAGPSGSSDPAARDGLVAAVNLTRSATARFSLSTLTGGLPTLIGNGIADGPHRRIEGSPAALVVRLYEQVWNRCDDAAVEHALA